MSTSDIEWISHRGLHGKNANGTVENTHRAFELAVDDSFEWLETDLRISKDGIIFLAHDPSLERIANESINAETKPWNELSRVTLEDGQHLVRFDDFLEAYQNKKWVFDIKPENGMRTLEKLFESHHSLLAEKNSQIWYQIWKPEHRDFLRSKIPGARMFASMAHCYQAGLANLFRMPALGRIGANTMFALPPKFIGINLYQNHMIRPYLNRSAQVLAYLPDKDDEIRAALTLPFELLLTNRKKSSFTVATEGRGND